MYRCFVKKPMRSSKVCVQCFDFCIGLGLGLASQNAHNDTNASSLFPSVYWSSQNTRSILWTVRTLLKCLLKELTVAKHIVDEKLNDFVDRIEGPRTDCDSFRSLKTLAQTSLFPFEGWR